MNSDRMDNYSILVSHSENRENFRRWVLTTGLALLCAKGLWLLLQQMLLLPVTQNELTLYENVGMAVGSIAWFLPIELPIYAAVTLYLKSKSAETGNVPGFTATFGLIVSPLLPLMPMGALFSPEGMGHFVFCGLVTATVSTICVESRQKSACSAAV
jgi:hypothetical protein